MQVRPQGSWKNYKTIKYINYLAQPLKSSDLNLAIKH